MRRLLVLMHALPPEARSARENPDEQPWGVVEELLAQVVEVTSVTASGRQMSEPRQVPRPGAIERAIHHPAPTAGPAAQNRPATPTSRQQMRPGAKTTVGLADATWEMAAWAARNGGVGGAAEVLGYGKKVTGDA